jgi:hypothetical protein
MQKRSPLNYEPVPRDRTPNWLIAWRIIVLIIAFPIVLMALCAPRN